MKTIDAKQSGQYSWIAKTEDDKYVFTAEIDHTDKERNVYRHAEGVFTKSVPPVSVESGDTAQTVKHAKELFEALTEAQKESMKCQLILVKGTKNGTTTTGIRAAIDGDNWMVQALSGSFEEGYEFTLERTE